MSAIVVESTTTPDDYIRVAATITDLSSNINKVFAFAHSTRVIDPDVNAILTFIAANPDAVVTLFDPNTGDTTSTPPYFEVIGFIRKVITSDISVSPAQLEAVDASSTYHVYIVTQNDLGYNKVWESTNT